MYVMNFPIFLATIQRNKNKAFIAIYPPIESGTIENKCISVKKTIRKNY